MKEEKATNLVRDSGACQKKPQIILIWLVECMVLMPVWERRYKTRYKELSSLTQAAGILGGSVDSGSSGSYNSSASGIGHSASEQGGSGSDTSVKAETGALAAFVGKNLAKNYPIGRAV